MTNSFYRSSTFSSGDLARNADATFAAADANRNGRLDINEFRNLVGQNVSGAGYSSGSAFDTVGYGAGYGAGYGGVYGAGYNGVYGAGYNGVYGAGYGSGRSVYESSAYGAVNNGLVGAAGAYDAAYAAGGYGAGAGAVVQRYATDAQGLYQDANPQIIRRPNPSGVQTYQQNIRVRFLQPPPVQPHGPLIIREVRPPQPPVPLPLRLRQVAPPLPTPAPLVLRERPPQPPASIPSQTVIRRLPPVPLPPRSVIVERLPALPPRPRDVVIERWVPYGAQAKRRTLLQRAGPAIQYPQPRNVIIQYNTAPVRVVRQFQRLGVSAASPAAYVQQYGGSLLDAGMLVSQARSAGIVEDISPPGVVAPLAFNAGAYGFGAAAADAGVVGGFTSSAYESGNYLSGAGAYNAGYTVGNGFAGNGLVSNGFVSNGLVSNGVVSTGVVGNGLVSNGVVSTGLVGNGVVSTGVVGNGLVGGVDVVRSAFAAADVNGDGTVDQGEFRNFVGNGARATYSGASRYESSASY